MLAQEISFPKGLIGFKDAQEFKLAWDSSQAPFYLLEEVEGELSFILIPPAEFAPEFQISPTEEETRLLDLAPTDELVVFALITIPKDPSQMSANLQGPLLINLSKKIGLQVIRQEEELRYPVLAGYERQAQERKPC